MASQEIQIFSNGIRIYTNVLFEGAKEPTPVLVDTGSSELAVCPGSDMGNTQNTGYYASCAYGDGSYGWVGQWYEGTATIGTQAEGITDPKPILGALMTNQNAGLCSSNLKGILGVDFGGNQYYANPQQIGVYGGRPYSTQKASFATTMLNEGDDYTMAFIGVTQTDTTGAAVIAFGATAEEKLSKDKLVGSTPIIKSNNIWYTLTTPMTVSFKNVEGVEKTTYTATSVNYEPIIDSGTPTLVLPNNVQQALSNGGYTISSLPSDAIIVIQMPGDLTLELPVSQLGNVAEYVTFSNQPILGFPVFWVYDIKFQTQKEVLSFYSR